MTIRREMVDVLSGMINILQAADEAEQLVARRDAIAAEVAGLIGQAETLKAEGEAAQAQHAKAMADLAELQGAESTRINALISEANEAAAAAIAEAKESADTAIKVGTAAIQEAADKLAAVQKELADGEAALAEFKAKVGA